MAPVARPVADRSDRRGCAGETGPSPHRAHRRHPLQPIPGRTGRRARAHRRADPSRRRAPGLKRRRCPAGCSAPWLPPRRAVEGRARRAAQRRQEQPRQRLGRLPAGRGASRCRHHPRRRERRHGLRWLEHRASGHRWPACRGRGTRSRRHAIGAGAADNCRPGRAGVRCQQGMYVRRRSARPSVARGPARREQVRPDCRRADGWRRGRASRRAARQRPGWPGVGRPGPGDRRAASTPGASTRPAGAVHGAASSSGSACCASCWPKATWPAPAGWFRTSRTGDFDGRQSRNSTAC